MASVWIRCPEGEWYVVCSNLVEAYSFGCSLSNKPPSFYTICNQCSIKSIHSLSVFPIHVSIYEGVYSPPVREEWFPNGIIRMTLSEVLRNPLYLEKAKQIQEMKTFEQQMKQYIQQEIKLYKS